MGEPNDGRWAVLACGAALCLVVFCQTGLLGPSLACELIGAARSLVVLLWHFILTLFGTAIYYPLYPLFALFSCEPPLVHW